MTEILVVEDDPLLALDLGHELEQLGYRVSALAESAEEAMIAFAEYRPDLVVMDINIVGATDGIETAHMMNAAFHVPVVFLTSASDDETMARAARESLYGYLVKPFKLADLKAAIQFALQKARMDMKRDQAHSKIAATVSSIPVGVVMIALDQKVQFMNLAAEQMTGRSLADVQGRQFFELFRLTDSRLHPLRELDAAVDATPFEEFGCSLSREGGTSILVDLTISPLKHQNGRRSGFVVTMRDAAERLRSQAVEEVLNEMDSFHLAPMPMVQLDCGGNIVRMNEAMLKKTGMDPALVVGRSLTALSMDPDPRIAHDFVHKLLQQNTSIATGRPLRMH